MPPTLLPLVAAAVLALAPAPVFAQTRADDDAVKAVASNPDQVARFSNPAPDGSPQRFDVRAKPEWSDDQGFYLDAARVAYRLRF